MRPSGTGRETGSELLRESSLRPETISLTVPGTEDSAVASARTERESKWGQGELVGMRRRRQTLARKTNKTRRF